MVVVVNIHGNIFHTGIIRRAAIFIFALVVFASSLLIFPMLAVADVSSDVVARTELAQRLSDNINISVPSRVSYVAKSDGTLLTPSPEALYLKNNSNYELRVAKVQMSAASGWQFVEDADNVFDIQDKAAELTITPMAGAGNDQAVTQSSSIDAIADSTLDTKKTVHTSSQTITPLMDAEPMWTMTAADASSNSEDTQASELHFEIEGAIASPNAEFRATSTIGSTQWYVVADTVTNDFRNRISTLENKVTTLENEKAQLQQDLDAAENRLDAIDGANGTVAGLDSRISAAETSVGNLATALGNSSSGLTKRVGDAETNIGNLQQSMSKLFKVKSFSQSFTQAAGANASYTIDCTVSGYKLLGVVSITTNNAYMPLQHVMTSGQSVVIYTRNTGTSSASGNIQFVALYCLSSALAS